MFDNVENLNQYMLENLQLNNQANQATDNELYRMNTMFVLIFIK